MSFSFGRFLLVSFPVAGLTLALGASGRHNDPRADYDAGLQIWRKPGATSDHGACANCHGPDGIELASYNFDDADIVRRASVHLDYEDTQAVVRFIHAVRERYGIRNLYDPM